VASCLKSVILSKTCGFRMRSSRVIYGWRRSLITARTRLYRRRRYLRGGPHNSMHNRMRPRLMSSLDRPNRLFSISSLFLLNIFDNNSRLVSPIHVPRSGKGRLDNLTRPLAWNSQIYQAVEIVEHFWIPKDRCAPVSIDAPLQLRMGF
jgi:hypothetical protein